MKSRNLCLAAALFAVPSLIAGPISYVANLDGPSEVPPNASPGLGTALITIDVVAHTLSIDSVLFSGLLGNTTASHIHCCTAVAFTGTAGVATQTPSFTGFPLGVTSGSYSQLFDTSLASTWNAPFVSANGGTPLGAEAALAAGLAAGKAYYNIHSSFAGGGEIRGFLVPTPEPASMGLVGLALGSLLFGLRRRGF